jgi:SAM-dependent methyltransferase
MLDRIWQSILRSAPRVRRFPPPRIATEAQARRVRAALAAFLARDVGRFHHLFLAGKPLKPDAAEQAWMEELAAAGYVMPARGGAVAPCLRIFFLDDLLIATDLLAHDHEDQVFSLMLEQVFLVRTMDVRKGDRVLELCLGSGVNAIAAARRGAARVVGVDVSPRALAFAQANAAVNLSQTPGAVPLTMLSGNLFEPLAADDRFDVVLVNPPFELVPPGARYFLHSHGGEDGLDVVRAMLPGLPARLKPGGRFEMYTWTPGDEASERVTDLVLATLPGHRIEVRRVDGLPLMARIERFRDRPGYTAWLDRLVRQGITYVWGVDIRALPEGPPGVVRIDAMDDVRACEIILSQWK